MQSYCKRSPNCHSFPGVHQIPTGLCAPTTVHSHWGALLSLPGAGQALQARPCQQSHQHVRSVTVQHMQLQRNLRSGVLLRAQLLTY